MITWLSFFSSLSIKVILYEDLVLNHDKIGTQLRGAGLGDVDPRKV
jgi:hypothetical protein